MIGNFRALSPDEVRQVEQDPSVLDGWLDAWYEGGDEPLDVDKAWHGIHYLLTGTSDGADTPAGKAVFGGVEVGDEIGYGPARLMQPDEVAEVAAALEAVDVQTLGERFDAAKMKTLGIYPDIWDEGAVARSYLLPYYDELRAYYVAAARRGDGMLLFMT